MDALRPMRQEIALATVFRSPNRFLASLSSEDFDLLHPHLRPFKLVHEVVLTTAGATLPHVFFPLNGIISLVVRLSEGQTIEAAMIGNDSLFGGSAALNSAIAINDAIVQMPGMASVLDIAQFREAASRSASLRATIVRHEQALLAQTQQSVACNATHVVEARLSRCILRARDLSEGDTMQLTQEFLAQMLGVQRTSVTAVAANLQRAGLIRYIRGSVRITDLDGLHKSSCECYEAVKIAYNKLLPKAD